MSCSESPCSDCHAGCCRAFAVPMTGADVIRIEQSGHDFWEFGCRWADPDGAIAQNYAPHIRFADEPQTPFVLCLMHVPSETYEGTGRCRFLNESPTDDQGNTTNPGCSIYDSRPAACRAFPMKFDPSREIVELHPVYDPPRAAESDAYKLCPRPWSPSDVNGVEAASVLAAAEYEASFFAKVIQLWNRKPGEWTAFPNFLRLVYGSRVRAEVIPTPVESEDPVLLPIHEYRRPAASVSDSDEKATPKAA